MALWIDRHRPLKLEELSIQPQANAILQNISQSFSFPHLLFSGPPGSGKKTRVMAFLRALFDSEIELARMKSEYRSIEIKDSKTIEVQVTSSPCHVELTPADSGNNDRHVISFFLKEIAASQTVNSSKVPIKVVIINEAHRLSRLAQQALRRTMEKYAKTCRIILICDSLSQIIEPVRSRCLIIRTPRVSPEEVSAVLAQISTSEKLDISPEIADQLVKESQGNLRRAINLLQMLSIQKKDNVEQILPEWEKYIDELVQIIVGSDISPDTMKKIRNHLYELLVHCIPPTEIFKRLLTKLCSKTDQQLVPSITEAAAIYESRMQNGTKPIFHLEAFVARFICIYRDYLAEIAS